jgi:hypothetical protein
VSRTDWASLEHEFPDEGVGHSLVEVALQRGEGGQSTGAQEGCLCIKTDDVDCGRLVALFWLARHGQQSRAGDSTRERERETRVGRGLLYAVVCLCNARAARAV